MDLLDLLWTVWPLAWPLSLLGMVPSATWSGIFSFHFFKYFYFFCNQCVFFYPGALKVGKCLDFLMTHTILTGDLWQWEAKQEKSCEFPWWICWQPITVTTLNTFQHVQSWWRMKRETHHECPVSYAKETSLTVGDFVFQPLTRLILKKSYLQPEIVLHSLLSGANPHTQIKQ